MPKNTTRFEMTPLKDYLRAGKGNYTQEEVAAQIGATQGYISDLVRKKQSMYVVNDRNAIKLIEFSVVKGRPLPIPADRKITVLSPRLAIVHNNRSSFELTPLKDYLRTGKGKYTQQQAAAQIGVRQGYISDVLRKKRSMYVVKIKGKIKLIEFSVVKGHPLPIPTDRKITVLAEG